MIDFVLLCREQQIPLMESGHHHCHEGWIQVHCPFCGDGSHGWHLGFSTEYGNMNCWRCGKQTVYEWLIAVLPSGTRSQAWELLKLYKIKTTRIIKTKRTKVRQRNTKPPQGTGPLAPSHKKYLKDRKFNPMLLEAEWGLRGTRHLSRDWNWRVIAPIHNRSGKIVAYTGRTLSAETKPRWKTTPEEDMGDDPKKLIYGIEKAKPKRGVLIVEGPSDVWRMGPGAVGLLGIDWSVEQAGILRHFKRRFILFDPGIVSQKRAEKLAHWLAPLPGETEIIFDIPTDPGDLSQVDADNIMRELGLRKHKL